MTKFIIAKMPNPSQIGWSNIAPEGCMSGQGDCSRAFTWILKIVIFVQWLCMTFWGVGWGGECYHECFASLTFFFFFFWGGGDKSPAKSTVTKWYRKFQSGRQALEDDKHYGCPVTAVTAENIAKGKSLVKEDPRLTHEEKQDAQSISSGSVNNSLHDHLSV